MRVKIEYKRDKLVVVVEVVVRVDMGEVDVGEVEVGEFVAAYWMDLPRGLVGEEYGGIFFGGSLYIVPSL